MIQYPVSLIAYYLPQYHRIHENDEWWGEGFTDWSNVTRALPRYIGHYQPRRPGALGFYDLTDIDTLKEQSRLARLGGISGFCIHHYWFSGKSILNSPIKLLARAPDIDIGFCINWANENWTRRWDGGDTSVLLAQRYESEDARHFAHSIREIIADPRYIRIDQRPLIMIYRPDHIPEPSAFMAKFRRAVIDEGGKDPYLVMPLAFENDDPKRFGMDAMAGFPPHGGGNELPNDRLYMDLLDSEFRGSAHSYDRLVDRMLRNNGKKAALFPGVCPGWDNEARRGVASVSYYGSTPAKYGAWLQRAALRVIEEQPFSRRLVFINAWNEWAEGAYLEPDRHFGYAYLAETRRTMERVASGLPIPAVAEDAPAKSRYRYVLNKAREIRHKISLAFSNR